MEEPLESAPESAAAPQSVRLRKRARAAFKQGDYDNAAKYYRKLFNVVGESDADSSASRDHVEAGTAMFRCGDYKGAACEWEVAIRYQPENGSLAYKLGQVELRLGEPQRALKAFRKAASLATGDAGVQWAYAEVALSLGEREEAEVALAATIVLDPQNEEAKAAMRRLLAGAGALSGEAQRLMAREEDFAQLTEFIRNRPGEDAPEFLRPSDQTFKTMLILTMGAAVFIIFYLYIRVVLIG